MYTFENKRNSLKFRDKFKKNMQGLVKDLVKDHSTSIKFDHAPCQ